MALDMQDMIQPNVLDFLGNFILISTGLGHSPSLRRTRDDHWKKHSLKQGSMSTWPRDQSGANHFPSYRNPTTKKHSSKGHANITKVQ